MAIAITADREVMDHMLFGPMQPAMQQYIQQTSNYFMNTLNEVGRQFVEHAQNVFARTSEHEAMEIARAALRAANTYFQKDVVFTMNQVEQLQEAPDTMVRWIMCHPQLRQLYYQERIDGYGHRYFDAQPGPVYGWDHVDYQYVYSGWIQPVLEKRIDEETGEEVEEWWDEHVEVLMDEDDTSMPILLDEEMVSIHLAHNLVDIALADKRDPTSYYDNEIV